MALRALPRHSWNNDGYSQCFAVDGGRFQIHFSVLDPDDYVVEITVNSLGKASEWRGRRCCIRVSDRVSNGEVGVSSVWITSSPENGFAYGPEEIIVVRVGFSQDIEAVGTPTIALSLDEETRLVPLFENTATALFFRYPVQAGDIDASGISILPGALSLNGGSIRDTNGTPADLDLGDHASTDDSLHRVDGSEAGLTVVSSVSIAGSPQDGVAYGAGEAIEVQVYFSQEVEVTGSPTLALGVGGGTRRVSVAWTWESGLTFRYEVQAEDRDADGISVPPGALNLDGGSIRSAKGADAELDLGRHAVENHPDHRVDGGNVAPPVVSGVSIAGSPQDGVAYGAGEAIEVQVYFSQEVEVMGSPTLALGVGGGTRRVSVAWTWESGLTFRYEVQAEDRDADGISVPPGALNLDGGSIRSAKGADAELDLGRHAVENHPDHRVDGGNVAPPVVSGVSIAGSPQDGVAYGAGEAIEVQVYFSQEVEVTGSPTLALGVGGGTRRVSVAWTWESGLTFRYEVQAEDRDADGISVPPGALNLDGGSIRSAKGADAELDLGRHAVENHPDHRVDGGNVAPPVVSGVSIAGSPQDGVAYGAGESIFVHVSFSQEIEVTGSPTLALGVGRSTRQASLLWTSSSGLMFRYDVQAGDRDADGVSILPGALDLDGGSILSAKGADAELDLGRHAVENHSDHRVDGGN